MGGSGSGTWSRYEAKRTIDEVPAIDIRELQRHRGLAPGSRFVETWTLGGMIAAQVAIEVRQDYLLLRYMLGSRAAHPEPVELVAPIVVTPCNYGGLRRWFRCPDCKKRIAVIYIQLRSCLCRRCNDLVYRSQHERAGERARDRAQKTRMRLGGSANLHEPLSGQTEMDALANLCRIAN